MENLINIHSRSVTLAQVFKYNTWIYIGITMMLSFDLENNGKP